MEDNHVMYLLEFFALVICCSTVASSLVSRLIDRWHAHVATSLDLVVNWGLRHVGRNSLAGETPRRDSCLGVTSLLRIPIHQKEKKHIAITL